MLRTKRPSRWLWVVLSCAAVVLVAAWIASWFDQIGVSWWPGTNRHFLWIGRGEIDWTWARHQAPPRGFRVNYGHWANFDPPELGQPWPSWFSNNWISQLTVPIWIPTAALVTVTISAWTCRRYTRSKHECPCGYSTTGITESVCPECGRTIKKPADV